MSNTLRRGLTVVFLALVGIQMTSAQYATVRGFVTDDGGQALFGVNIVVQTTKGRFSELPRMPKASTLFHALTRVPIPSFGAISDLRSSPA